MTTANEDMVKDHDRDPVLSKRFRLALGTVTLLGLAAFVVATFRLLLWSLYNEDFWIDLVREQPAAILGLPLAAIAALGLVLLLESTAGHIEFEIAGMRFKGAAGPIVFWVLSFLSMAIAIRLTWV